MIYDIDYFIEKFTAIPEKNWTVGSFRVGSQRCALGHCLHDETINMVLNEGFKSADDYREPPESNYKPNKEELETTFKEAYALSKIFDPQKPANGSATIIKINNGTHGKYKQSTPKKRILAALLHIKKHQSQEKVVL